MLRQWMQSVSRSYPTQTRPQDLIRGWLTTVDHKRLGILYLAFALIFLLIGGTEASIMRLQLMRPENDLVSPQLFNRLFTMHGTTMIFFVAMPLVFGFANYLVPLMIGARDMAFPRLNAFSLWLTVCGGVILYASVFGGFGFLEGGNAPDAGWFAYAPLTSRAFSPGHGADFWTLGVLVSGVGSVGTAINIVTTIVCLRCPGMTLGRMPLFVWLNLITAGLVMMAIGPLTAAQVMLLVDRYLGGHFFDPAAGGSPVLWMHFFWIFGHPEVYVLVLPAFGIASEIIPVFSRKVMFGYPVMVGATVAIGFIGMSVWAHHMFAIGMNSYANTYFVLMTMAISVPTGIKIFNWLATMWGGNLQFKTPMLFCLAFLFQFLIAGLTGMMLGSAPFDWQLTGSYFVVAHFHYVIVGGILFCVFGAFYYWFPKMSGHMLNERLGQLHFWLFVIGFHLTFDAMHIPGLLGMPRRIYTYEPGRGWELWNLIVTVGVPLQAAAIVAFVANLVWSYFRGPSAGNDPWDAWTLEWSTSSPPPVYNFASVPLVRSRRPLWDLKHPDDPDWHYEPPEPFATPAHREQSIVEVPANTPSPILLAFGLALIVAGLVTMAPVSVAGATLALYGGVQWFRDVLPHERQEWITTTVADPASTTRPAVTQRHRTTGQRHRARLPLEIHPVTAGISGGLVGGAVMALLAMLWGLLSGHGAWYPVNLLAGGFFPDRGTPGQLLVFHWDALIIGTAIHVATVVFIGLLYGAVMPMLPRHPILLAGIVVPLITSAFAYSILGTVNPRFSELTDWPWFVACQVAFGTVAGMVVSRRERLPTWQHRPFIERAGLESDEAAERNGGADA
jgi:cytochrome c oxidase subunit 1